jgi:hypothetical protein
MHALMVAALLSVLAAATHATTAVVQESLAARSARRERVGRPGHARFDDVLRTLRARRWWIAVGLAITASLLHVVALRYGPLTVVQPLGALTLVLALPLRAAIAGHRVSVAEWRGAMLTVVGLAGLLALTASGRPTHVLGGTEVLALSVASGVLLAVLIGAALTTAGPIARSLLYAIGAGVSFGVSSAVTQTVVVRTSAEGVSALLAPATVVVLVLASGGLLLAQAAYRGGLGAPLATLTLINPITAALIGVTLLGERYIAGPVGAALAIAAAMVAAHGVLALARSGVADPSSWAPATIGVR